MLQVKSTVSLIFAIGLTLAISLVFMSSPVSSTNVLKGTSFKFLSDHSSSEIKNDFKVFLTKLKVRRVPLAKKRSEISLTKLYKDQRELKEEIANLEEDLNNIDRRRETVGKAELLSRLPKDNDVKSKSVQAKVKELALNKIKDMEQTLEQRKSQLAEIENDIQEAKEIAKNPEAYISIPKDFAKEDPDTVRENETQILIKDRENMLWRQQILNKEIEPTWITDGW